MNYKVQPTQFNPFDNLLLAKKSLEFLENKLEQDYPNLSIKKFDNARLLLKMGELERSGKLKLNK